MFFFQLPPMLPAVAQSDDSEIQEHEKNMNPSKGPQKPQKFCKLESLPEGLIGKMLVYKSGAVKLKIGDTLYDVSALLWFKVWSVIKQNIHGNLNFDSIHTRTSFKKKAKNIWECDCLQVSAGLSCAFAQDVVAINAEKKHCCNFGEINRRAVATPDIDSILEAVSELELWRWWWFYIHQLGMFLIAYNFWGLWNRGWEEMSWILELFLNLKHFSNTKYVLIFVQTAF